jgi:hypothetical protein
VGETVQEEGEGGRTRKTATIKRKQHRFAESIPHRAISISKVIMITIIIINNGSPN